MDSLLILIDKSGQEASPKYYTIKHPYFLFSEGIYCIIWSTVFERLLKRPMLANLVGEEKAMKYVY